MKRLTSLLLLLAALAGVARAQLIDVRTYDTTVSWDGASLLGLKYNTAYTETFTDVYAVYSMTYRFIASNQAHPSSNPVSFSAYFAQWNTATNQPIGAPISSFTFSVGAPNAFTGYDANNSDSYDYYDAALTLNDSSLDPTKTYGLILVPTGVGAGGTGVALQELPFSAGTDVFPLGQADSSVGSSSTQLTYSALASTYTGSAAFGVNSDYGFSQIQVLTNVPEAHTTAAIFAGVFVAGMIGYRTWQRRRVAALVPVPVAS